MVVVDALKNVKVLGGVVVVTPTSRLLVFDACVHSGDPLMLGSLRSSLNKTDT